MSTGRPLAGRRWRPQEPALTWCFVRGCFLLHVTHWPSQERKSEKIYNRWFRQLWTQVPVPLRACLASVCEWESGPDGT